MMKQEFVTTSQYRNSSSRLRSVKLSRLIVLLLFILIVVALVAHNYLSEFNSDGDLPSGYKSRKNMDHHSNDEFMYTAPNLNDEIQKLNKIKASVNNELRDMESKRQKLLSQISKYHMEIEDLRVTQESIEKEIKTTKLSLDQLRLQKDELDEKYVPILKAPQKILLGSESSQTLPPPSSSDRCKMYSCFDYSRCSLLSRFPVYFYDPFHLKYDKSLERFIKTSVISSLAVSPYVTQDPTIACIYVVLVGQLSGSETDSEKIQSFLHSLPYWRGDGRNHILLNVMRNYESSDLFSDVDVGRAIIVQSAFVDTNFRGRFDIVIPPSFGKSDGQVWEELSLISPIRRRYFLSFWGQYKGKLSVSDDKHSEDQMQQLSNIENNIILSLKNLQSAENQEIFIEFSCDSLGQGAINGEWSICGTAEQRKDLLLFSTFSLIIAPSNISYTSTSVFQLRLYESLKHGAIPVVLGDYVEMPFSDILDWKKAAIILPKARASEFYFILRTYTDNDIAAMRHVCRFYFETYFGTTKSIVDTVLAVLRTRLSIPATPIQDVPSPSVFNSSFSPLSLENMIVNPETDEVLGPLEPPFSSVRFKRNFTQYLSYQKFESAGDPFELFPFTPFEKILPSESKHFGSGYGFRPIGKGWGGAGKEFSESLGGNLPREQFTIVMLTYERESVLISAIQRLKGLPFLNKVIVVWNNPLPPMAEVRWPDIGVPVKVIKTTRNSLNNRFLPFDAIETEAILSIDDDAHLRHDEIVFGFRVWREEREKIVGFPGRYHAWDVNTKSWYYNSNYSCELSMVLTGAAFFHKYYAYLYTHVMPQAIRDKVDEYMNCEDIAMNFLVSHITRKPPIKVTSRWTFRCPGCPQTLSNDSSHFEERHKCMNFFVRVYGYMPLLYTQYRVDSVLFKTRLPHDKQKCFKFI